jgi:predicted nucleic acid-binding protein
MLIDTDVLIWLFRGRASARDAIEQLDSIQLSAITYMEMVQGMRNKEELRLFRRTIHDRQWKIIPLNENISHRATVYIENHALSHGLTMADSLIAASALESGFPLMSANVKHYRVITELTLLPYRP